MTKLKFDEMEQKDDLFLLIKSLEKNEKRYFKLFASLQKGEKIYGAVFDELDRQKTYNGEALIKKFKKTPSQFFAIKTYLYSLILKSLRNYEQKFSADFEIRELMNYAEILFRKGLHSQSSKILLKAKKIATRFDKYPALLDIINAEQQLAFFFFEEKKHFQKLQEESFETLTILDKLFNIHQRINISYRLNSLWEKGKPRTPENLKEVESVYNKFGLKNIKQSETFESLWHLYHIKQHFYRMSLQYEEAYVFCKKAIEHLESSKEKMHDNIIRYYMSLYSFMGLNTDLRRYDESLEVIKKIRKLMDDPSIRLNKGLEVKIFSLTYLIEMLIYMDLGEFEKGYKLIPNTENGIKKYFDLLTPINKMSLFYGLCFTYFCVKEYKNALVWLNKILSEPLAARPDIYLFARVQNLMIHYELGNVYILESLIRSTYGFLYKQKTLYQSEKAIILHFKKIAKSVDSKEVIQIFRDLKIRLVEILKDPHEKLLLDYIDILAWLDSKIRGLPFEVIIREKIKATKNRN